MNTRFGIFHLGEMQLALPLSAMREVVTAQGMTPLPSPAQGVIGAVDVRGRLVPVVDLRSALGMACTPGSVPDRIVVMAHRGRLLGLAAERCGGVVACPPGQFNRIDVQAGHSLLSGSFPCQDGGELVAVLDPEAVLTMLHVPAVEDSQTASAATGPAGCARSHMRHTLLFRSAGLPQAIGSSEVLTTLPRPEVLPSAVAHGYCVGVIRHGGLNIPAVDLSRLCLLESASAQPCRQAFLVRYAEGLIAYLVDEILDVLDVDFSQVSPVPAASLNLSPYFSGFLPMAALPETLQARANGRAGYCMVLDGGALIAAPELQGLASVITPASGETQANLLSLLSTQRTHSTRRQVLTYDLGFEAATSIDQFSEILPWTGKFASPECGEATHGLVMRQGRAVPVFCLARLLGLKPPVLTSTASVLVVDMGERAMGFAVAGLLTIDNAPADKLDAVSRGDDAASILSRDFRDCWSRMMIGRGDQERMRGVLDLRKLAATLLQSKPVLAA